MFHVDFPSLKHPGEQCFERYDALAEAVAACRVMRDAGRYPSIRCEEWRAMPFCANKWADRPRLQWSLTIPSVGGYYKGAAHYRAEMAGVRYLSHRRGYVASDSAFRRFCALWAELVALREAREAA